jgi:hypothetical protein
MLCDLSQHREGHIGKEGGEFKKGEMIVNYRERKIEGGGKNVQGVYMKVRDITGRSKVMEYY